MKRTFRIGQGIASIRMGITPLLCAATMAGALLSPVAAQDRPLRKEGTTAAPAAKAPMPSKATQKADAARKRLNEELEQFFGETDKMRAKRVLELKGFFEERKAGAPLFASQVLNVDAKLRRTSGLFEIVFSKAAETMGIIDQAGPDSFSLYVKRSFEEKVLDPAEVRRAVERVIAGYCGDIAAAEGRLLVALNVDLGDSPIDVTRAIPDLEVELRCLQLCDTMVEETLTDAGNDFNAGLATYVVSNVVGNALSKLVTPDDASRKRQLGTNFAVGVGVDMALDKGIRAAGYNPEGQIADRITSGIDRIASAIIYGDPEMNNIYPELGSCQFAHPDTAVRDACHRANEVIERNANLGMADRLRRIRNVRYFALWKALAAALVDAEEAASPFMMLTPFDADKASPPAQIIRWANAIYARYGGKG